MQRFILDRLLRLMVVVEVDLWCLSLALHRLVTYEASSSFIEFICHYDDDDDDECDSTRFVSARLNYTLIIMIILLSIPPLRVVFGVKRTVNL